MYDKFPSKGLIMFSSVSDYQFGNKYKLSKDKSQQNMSELSGLLSEWHKSQTRGQRVAVTLRDVRRRKVTVNCKQQTPNCVLPHSEMLKECKSHAKCHNSKVTQCFDARLQQNRMAHRVSCHAFFS